MNQKIYYFAREMGSTAYYLSIASRDIPCSIELVSSEGNGISQVIWGAGTCFINYYSNGGSYSMLQLVEDANAGGSDNCSVTGYRLGWLGGNFDGNEVGESIPLTNYGDCTSSNSSCSRLYFQPGEILPANQDFRGFDVYEFESSTTSSLCKTAQNIVGSGWVWFNAAPSPWTVLDMTPVPGLITLLSIPTGIATLADLYAYVATIKGSAVAEGDIIQLNGAGPFNDTGAGDLQAAGGPVGSVTTFTLSGASGTGQLVFTALAGSQIPASVTIAVDNPMDPAAGTIRCDGGNNVTIHLNGTTADTIANIAAYTVSQESFNDWFTVSYTGDGTDTIVAFGPDSISSFPYTGGQADGNVFVADPTSPAIGFLRACADSNGEAIAYGTLQQAFDAAYNNGAVALSGFLRYQVTASAITIQTAFTATSPVWPNLSNGLCLLIPDLAGLIPDNVGDVIFGADISSSSYVIFWVFGNSGEGEGGMQIASANSLISSGDIVTISGTATIPL
jgi:hypothetical protein